MEVAIIPFDAKYLAETLAMIRHWSPDHPELGERSLYDWQRCSRYLALAGGKVVGHIGQIAHEFRYANGRSPVKLGWGITLVLDMSDDATRKAAGRQLLKACEDAPGPSMPRSASYRRSSRRIAVAATKSYGAPTSTTRDSSGPERPWPTGSN